jgi:hypothetical protein
MAMNGLALLFVAWGFLSMAMDAFLWGIAGNVVFRFFRIGLERWWGGAVALWALYFAWDEVLAGFMARASSVSFENTSLTDLLGENPFSLDIGSVISSLIISFAGFGFGRWLLGRYDARLRNSDSKPLASPAFQP